MQLTLFETKTTQYGQPVTKSPKQLARSTDPITSKIAAATTVACGLNENQALFVATLRKSVVPLTASEVAEKAVEINDLAKVQQAMSKRESVRKRAKELVDLGWIKVCESRECKVTGHAAQTYEVV
jgi:hypothetical protein